MIWDLQRYGDKTALVDDRGEVLTYTQLFEEVQKIKEEVFSKFDSQSLIFMLCRNSVSCIVHYISCLYEGIPVLLLPDSIPQEHLESLCIQYQPQYLCCPKERIEMFKGRLVEYGNDYSYVRTSFNGKPLHSELALLLTTSGTTGSRKLVRISRQNIISNTMAICKALQIGQDDKAVTSLPLHYTYGLSVLHTHLFSGASVLVTDKKVFQSEFWEFFRRAGGTSFAGVAYTYRMLRKMGFSRWEFGKLQTMTQAGEKLSDDMYCYLAGMAEKRGIRFQPMYGQTEATARITVMPYERVQERTGSVGKVIDGGRLELLDEHGNILCEPNRRGRLVYYGNNVAMGYAFSREDLCKGDEWKGRLDTGDEAWIDEEEFLYIAGRKDRYQKLSGKRIAMDEVEELLQKEFPGEEFQAKCEEDRLYVAGTFKECEQNKVLKYLSDSLCVNRKCIELKHLEEMPVSANGKKGRVW